MVTQPRALARASSASRRDETPSFRSRLFTCDRTVCSEMKSRFAISSVPRCSSRSRSTSNSRAESAAAIESGTPPPRARAGGGPPARRARPSPAQRPAGSPRSAPGARFSADSRRRRRGSREGRRLDLFLCTGFLITAVTSATLVISPAVAGHPPHRVEAWSAVVDQLRGVRTRCCRGTCSRCEGDPRRSGAVPVRCVDARDNAATGRPAGGNADEAEGGGRRSAAGSARRFVSIRDDGEGFDGYTAAAGQGLNNIRARAKAIKGGFTLTSRPGRGTALEVVLRT